MFPTPADPITTPNHYSSSTVLYAFRDLNSLKPTKIITLSSGEMLFSLTILNIICLDQMDLKKKTAMELLKKNFFC